MSALTEIREIVEAFRDMSKDASEIGLAVMQWLTTKPDLEYRPDNISVFSRALQRMQSGTAPRIALVGITCSGKSTLINALFGQPIAEVKRTRDTTNCILMVTFPSGLVIYDTPGIYSDEMLENITRMFLNLRQRGRRKFKVDRVPLRDNSLSEASLLDETEIQERALIDVLLWVVNAHSVPDRGARNYLRSFYLELEKFYPGRVVVAGTHLDELNKLSAEERKDNLEDWTDTFNGNLIPVSSTNGEGLDDLVPALFRSLSEEASLVKLQETLRTSRKIDRLSFVTAESSKILAGISLLTGKQEDEIRIATIVLFAIICNHYAVDEKTWLRCNGDAMRIGSAVKESGISTDIIQRAPQGFWEKCRGWFGESFFSSITVYQKLGLSAVEELLPKVYEFFCKFDKPNPSVLTANQVKEKVRTYKKQIEALAKKDDQNGLAAEIETLLAGLIAKQD